MDLSGWSIDGGISFAIVIVEDAPSTAVSEIVSAYAVADERVTYEPNATVPTTNLLARFNVYNAMSAGIAVGILCFPTVCSLAEDALQAVPNTLRDGALGLGGTRFDATVKVILPAALSGIVSAFLLAIARAIGETMIVALAAGSRPQATIDPRKEIQTMTGFMVQMAGGDVSNFGTEYFSMYAVAFTLFIMTLSLTMIGNLVRKRFRETYE